jgi:hypothetical protein
VLVALVLAAWFAWTTLTLWFANWGPPWLRAGLAGAYLAWLGLVLVFLRPRRRGRRGALASSLLVALAHALVRPSNERDWLPDVAVTPTMALDGERVTVRGVRNFRYRSESDFDVRWEERSYDLAGLRTLDLVMSYWGPVDYCHTFLSFGFEDGEQLAASVETRKEVGESYSTWAGFFKRYELVYVLGDERDLIGVRARQRGEHVYLYRLRVQPERLRELFLSYLGFADELARTPQFYGVLRNSCGVNILQRVAETGRTVFASREALLNGHWDRHLYEQGVLDQSLPFEELRRRSRIDERARAAGDSTAFSALVREGLPGPPPWEPAGDAARGAR